MAAYITISVGARPQDARAVLVSDDRGVVSATIRALLARVGGAALLEGAHDGVVEQATHGQTPTDNGT
jgi:hypothetical protein